MQRLFSERYTGACGHVLLFVLCKLHIMQGNNVLSQRWGSVMVSADKLANINELECLARELQNCGL